MPVRPRVTRRDFLKTTAAVAVAAGSGSWLTGCLAPKTGPHAPRIIIVGGGVAGLNAACKLKKRGWRASVYEASPRAGGRIYTANNLLNPGLTTELGGEFIDSNHTEMRALAREFGLPTYNVHSPAESRLVREAYYFDGAHYSEAQAVDAFRPLAARIQADFAKLADVVDFEHDGGGKQLDRTSLADYLDQIGASGWLRKLLDVAFVTEYGLECGDQSSLNMIRMISTDLSQEKWHCSARATNATRSTAATSASPTNSPGASATRFTSVSDSRPSRLATGVAF